MGSIETIIEKGRDFQADQVFTSWIQPDGILVYLNDGLGLSKPKPGGRGNQRVRTRKPFRFPLPSITEGVKAEEIGDVVVVAAEARNEPETPDVPEVVEAEQPKNNEETVFRC